MSSVRPKFPCGYGRKVEDMRVVVQVASLVRSGYMHAQVLKYDVTYDRSLGVVCWQLLPGQEELIPISAVTGKGYRPMISESRKG